MLTISPLFGLDVIMLLIIVQPDSNLPDLNSNIAYFAISSIWSFLDGKAYKAQARIALCSDTYPNFYLSSSSIVSNSNKYSRKFFQTEMSFEYFLTKI